MASTHPPLQFLSPAWFSIVMGLCGLSLAWLRAAPLQRHPGAWRDDCTHPVRHTFLATVPVSLILLATVAVGLFGVHPAANALWWAGSLGQLGVTLWVVSRWWRGNQAGGLQWQVVTPALIIPVVGNVLVPLAGVTLGHAEWSAAQFGIGVLFWPVVLALLVVRIAAQAFTVTHWGLSFPMAALAGLTVQLATPGGLLAVLAPMLLALTSLTVFGLGMGTVRGLRQGTLLAPEPVAMIQPVGTN